MYAPCGVVVIGALYHPPKPIYHSSDLRNFIDRSVENISSQAELIMLAGDFNEMTPDMVTEVTGLIDIVTDPTRGASHLDHIMVSQNDYERIKVVKSLVNSDHLAVVAYCGEIKVNLYKARSPH